MTDAEGSRACSGSLCAPFTRGRCLAVATRVNTAAVLPPPCLGRLPTLACRAMLRLRLPLRPRQRMCELRLGSVMSSAALCCAVLRCGALPLFAAASPCQHGRASPASSCIPSPRHAELCCTALLRPACSVLLAMPLHASWASTVRCSDATGCGHSCGGPPIHACSGAYGLVLLELLTWQPAGAQQGQPPVVPSEQEAAQVRRAAQGRTLGGGLRRTGCLPPELAV